jgi:hypothetical protein
MTKSPSLESLQRAPDITAFVPEIDDSLAYVDLAWLYSRYQRWYTTRFQQLPTRSWKSFAEELEARGFQVRVVRGERRVYA